jgi:hypothetical protein
MNSSKGTERHPFKLTVEGFEELKSKITLLSNDKDKRKEILMILRQAARPTVVAAKNAAPSGPGSKKRASGSLKQSIGLIASKSENPTVLVGARVVKGKLAVKKGRYSYGDGWYAHFVDLGHNLYNNKNLSGKITKKYLRKRRASERVTKKRVGIIAGRTKAVHFMSKAHQQTYFHVLQDDEKKVAKFIQRRINKLSN